MFTQSNAITTASILVKLDDLKRRWNEHCNGKGSDWTRKHKPLRIVHFEELPAREAAVSREKELKTTGGRQWLKEQIKSGRAAGGIPFEEKMAELSDTLYEPMRESIELDTVI